MLGTSRRSKLVNFRCGCALVALSMAIFPQFNIVNAQYGGSADTMKSDCCTIRSGKMSVTVDPNVGARVVSLKLDGFEFLTGPDIIQDNYGSTLWPSPQSSWKWPPPPVLDNEPYEMRGSDDTIKFVSGKNDRTGFQFIKEFYPGEEGRLELIYTIVNVSPVAKSIAPWEITRVHKGGLLFFPAGKNPLGRKYFDPVPAEVVDGISWYKDPPTRPSANQLTIGNDTEGWAAYAVGGKLFVKKFPNVKPGEVAPGEGEVALYVSGAADYLEFEIEGKYLELNPGACSKWQVEWIVVDIPDGIEAIKSSERLVDFVRRLVK